MTTEPQSLGSSRSTTTRAAGGSPRASSRLLVDEPVPGVARLVISNPGKRGALDTAILDQLRAELESLDARCVIITGELDAFSAGCDLDELRAASKAADVERLVSEHLDPALDAVAGYPYPTIAAMNGHAIGAGLDLAIACDLRVGAETAYLMMPPGKLGVVYSPAGVGRFIDVIGTARTRQLFLVGGRIDAVTALRWGLLNEMVEVNAVADRAIGLARTIVANAPLSLRGNKRVIATARRYLVDDGVEEEILGLRRASFCSDDFREGLSASADRRTPRWSGR